MGCGASATKDENKANPEPKPVIKELNNKDNSFSSDEEENVSPMEQAKIDAEMKRLKEKKKGVERKAVSAEVYGDYNKKEDFVPRNIPKSPEERQSILDKCGKSFLFNCLEDNDLNTVLQAFEKKCYNPGENVIVQGDEGDVLYLVDQGELDCEKVFKAGDKPTHLKVYHPGESFGELALLYNCPRAATIRAKTKCVLWALDRMCFNHIVKDAAIQKRERHEATLKKVSILSTIDPYEVSQIADALKGKKVTAGTTIIKQGENGNEFYILEEGKAYASKVIEPGKGPERVLDYSSGSYFGELALLHNAPRAASVIAETDCKLLMLNRDAFKRLLGPLEELLKRNSEQYVKYVQK